MMVSGRQIKFSKMICFNTIEYIKIEIAYKIFHKKMLSIEMNIWEEMLKEYNNLNKIDSLHLVVTKCEPRNHII